MERHQSTFFSNDLVGLYLAGEYENSHWTERAVRENRVDYRSAIVVPIARFQEDRLIAEVLGSLAARYDIVGFLCIDARITGAFDESRDVDLAAALAHGLFPVLHLYRQDTYSEYEAEPS